MSTRPFRHRTGRSLGGALVAAGLFGAALAMPSDASADAGSPAATLVDRVVVRWHAPETGGVEHPQFIFERELAFEARLEAFTDPDPDLEAGSYRERHERAALDRHIAETLLASLAIVPEPTPKELAARAAVARAILEQRVHGKEHVLASAAAEGISAREVDVFVARQARASLYLDRMVAPMLEPADLELRDLWKAGATPFKDQPFEKVKVLIARWYVGQRVAQALETFYQNARSRLVVDIARPPT